MIGKLDPLILLWQKKLMLHHIAQSGCLLQPVGTGMTKDIDAERVISVFQRILSKFQG